MRLAINAGTLCHAITLDTPTLVDDGNGGYIETFVPLVPPVDYAAIDEPATATDQEVPLNIGTATTAIGYKVTLRYRFDVTLKTRLTFRDVGYREHLLYVRASQAPLEQGDVLVLWCEEKATP